MRANVAVWKMVLLGAAITAGSAGAVDAKTRGSHAQASGSVSHASLFRVSARETGTREFGARETGARETGAKRVRIGGHGRKDAYFARAASNGYHFSYSSGGGLQCVPFARENTGIELAGNAAAWWYAAEGVYQRGSRPEVGSILNFRATGRMHSGHVAVVSNVENARTVEIDHANWGNHGGVNRNVTVVDVSPDNDWSAVRVQLGQGGEFGSIYPTYGFIYDRPDHGTMVANNVTAPMPNALNPAPHDLRSAAQQADATDDEPVEVAEATPRGSYRHVRHSLIHPVKAAGAAHHGHKRLRS